VTAMGCRCSTGCAIGGRTGGFLYAFDLLELNGRTCGAKPLEVRKVALAAVLRRKAAAGIQYNDHCDDLPVNVVWRSLTCTEPRHYGLRQHKAICCTSKSRCAS